MSYTGYIYKLSSPNIKDFYIGSSAVSVYRRLSDHKFCSKSGSNIKLHKTMRESVPSSWDVEIIETVYYDHIDDLRIRENEYITSLAPTLNINRASSNGVNYHLKNANKQWYCDCCCYNLKFNSRLNHCKTAKHINEYNKPLILTC